MTENDNEIMPPGLSLLRASRNPSTVYTKESRRTLDPWLSKVWESSNP